MSFYKQAIDSGDSEAAPFLDQRTALLESTEVDFLTLHDGKTPRVSSWTLSPRARRSGSANYWTQLDVGDIVRNS